jgi:thiol-disulfide isomerase/thioredoxin
MSRLPIMDIILGVAVVSAIGLLLVKVNEFGDANTALVARVDSVSRHYRLASIKASALEEVLGRTAMPESFTDSAAALGGLLPERGGVLVYWMSPTCPSCRTNYPALASLAEQFPGQVVALSPDGVNSVRDEYAAMEVPAHRMSRATAAGVFPEATFPTTLILRDGRRVRYVVGKLHADSVARMFSDWHAAAVRDASSARSP